MREKNLVLLPSRIEEIMSEIVFTGHFVYSAGGHGDKYFDKSWITFWPLKTAEICSEIASQWSDEEVEVVVGPAIGGIKLADRVAESLTKITGVEIPALYTEKAADGSQVLKRGLELIEGKRVLIIEDIVNSGGSLLSSILACEKAGANIIGAHCLVDRSSGKVTPEFLGVKKFEALYIVKVDNFSAEECPLCKAGIPINTDRGHGQEYLDKLTKSAK